MDNRWSLTCALCALLTFPVFSQDNLWSDADESALRSVTKERWIVPKKYRSLNLNMVGMLDAMAAAPVRTNTSNDYSTLVLPFPDGTFQSFVIQESPILQGKLAVKNPDIKTYSGQGIDDPTLAAYIDVTPLGFHAMIIGPGKSFFIDPYFKEGKENYVCYDKRHFTKSEEEGFPCGYEPGGETNAPSGNVTPISGRNAAINLKTYNIAVAATAEYTAFHGSAANALAAITTTINRVRGIYETELAISFTLVANNNLIIYTDPATDPYSDTPTLTENQTNIDNVIGNANYDIGHLVDAGGNGGVAGLGVVCRTGLKALGLTGHTAPKGDPYDVDYVSHEIGHQFKAQHTFNGNLSSCGGGNRNASTAYEPNSGSTIMGYAGICGSQNIQQRSESHFHQATLQNILTYVTTEEGAGCPTITATTNDPPTVNADSEGANGKYIPINTPFELTATGSDPNGHSISYAWEQWDLGTEGTSSSSTDGPIFRSVHPTESSTRTFPRLSSILDNSTTIGEYLPSITRDLNFKCTVRDGRTGGGASDTDQITVHVTNSAADFAIASHNSTATVEGNITVNWNVGNTTAAPVNCANVDILLSTDGGHTFSALATNTANDGSETVTLPNNATGQARIKVKCSNNIFFDINNADLRIAPADATCAEQVTNGNFAANSTGWNDPGGLIGGWSGFPGYSNTISAWLGYFNNFTSTISQTISIPSGPHFSTLTFWYKLYRFDCGGDVFNIKVNGSVVQNIDICNNDAAMGWKRALVDLSAYAGTSPTIEFELINDGQNPSDVFVDEISVYTCTGGSFAVLPVELVDFQAVGKNGGAELSWITHSEKDNLGFEIEQQFLDGTFRSIDFVAGAGTTNSVQTYQSFVPNLPAGTHYFRLKQLDSDNGHTYSPVRSVKLRGDHYLNVFPNPAKELVYFELDVEQESELQLEVLNAAGQIVKKVADGRYVEGHFRWPMKVSELPAGIYFFRLYGNGFEENGKFLVE